MNVSEVEQDVASKDDQSSQLRRIIELIEDPTVGAVDALRLVMLFALRYETNRGSRVSEHFRPCDTTLLSAVAFCGTD
jgi:vacuolar protein sorting-associated protein 45